MEEVDYINVEHHGTLAVVVSMYPAVDTDRETAAVTEFFQEARTRLVPGMAMAGGPENIPPGIVSPLVTFYFGREHVPLPMEEVREWLIGHPLARLVEIERFPFDAQAT